MDKSLEALIGMAALAALALAVIVIYRWRKRERVRRVKGWVRDYLVVRHGKQPGGLRVDCSDDELWPVLVAFDDPVTGTRRRLRFACPGPRSAFSLVMEEGGPAAAAPARGF